MTDINVWNVVDDSNNVASPAGWPEGMMPSGVNNSARAMMGSLKRWRDQSQPTVLATGSGNAQVITYPVAPAALAAGDRFMFYSVATNTTAATLQVNAQPAKAIRTSTNAALLGGEMPTGAIITVYYDGTNFRLAGDATAVKRSGDVMTGQLTVPSIVYSANPANGFAFSWDGANTHVIINGADVGIIGDITSVSAGNGLSGGGTAGALSLAMSGSYSGNFFVTGNLNATGPIVSSGYVQGAGDVVAGGNFYTSAGTVTAARVQSTGDSNASGNMNCSYNINAGANMTATGTVQGAYVTSTGNVNAGTDIGCGRDVYATSGHVYSNLIFPNGDNQGGVGTAGRAYQAMFSYNYVTASDASLKTDIETPQGCLGLVEAIMPRIYRFREGSDTEAQHWGFVAQEVGAAMQTAGREFAGHHVDKESGREGLAYNELVSCLWGAVRELTARVKQLEATKEEI